MRTIIITFLLFTSLTTNAATVLITDFGATTHDSSDDDAVAINQAIEHTQSGDTVYIPAGKYHIKSAITLKSDIKIKGNSSSSSEIAGLIYGPGTYLLEADKIENVRVEKLRIRSNSPALDKGVGQIFRIKNSRDIILSELKLERFIKHAVYFNNTENGRLLGSRIASATEVNIGGHGYGVVFTNGCNGGRVQDNLFQGPMIRHGVVIQGDKNTQRPSHDIAVKYNEFVDNTQDSIDLHGYGEYNNYIEHNTIWGTSDGSSIGRGIGVGENVHGPSGAGNVIKHNTIINTRYGIHVLAGSKNVTIRYNTIIDCHRHGIYVENGSDLDIRDNLITGCRLWGLKVNEGQGIVIRKGSEDGNKINWNGKETSSRGGVYIESGVTGLDVQDNDFCNNDFSGASSANLQNTGEGTFRNNLCAE